GPNAALKTRSDCSFGVPPNWAEGRARPVYPIPAVSEGRALFPRPAPFFIATQQPAQLVSSFTDTISRVIARTGRSTVSDARLANALPMMIPGIEPTSSDAISTKSTDPISQ